MKRWYILSVLFLLSGASYGSVQDTVTGLGDVKVIAFEYVEDSVTVCLELDISDIVVRSGESVVFTPTLVRDGRSAFLPSVVVKGRNAKDLYGGARYLEIVYSGDSKREFISSGGVVSYQERVPYSKWMVTSQLALGRTLFGKRGVCKRSVEVLQEQPMFIAEIKSVNVFNFIPTVSALTPQTKEAIGQELVEKYSGLAESIKYCRAEDAASYIGFFDESSSEAQVVNIMGAYYSIVENYTRAKELFTRACELGSGDAVQNLKYLEIKIKNGKDIEIVEAQRAKIFPK